MVDNGLGKDMWTLQAHQITNVLQYYFFGEIFYILALGVTKISILCFYLRVFPSKDFRRIIFGIMWLSVAYTAAFFFATTFQCTPVSYAWTQWDGLHTGTCNDIHLQGWIAAGINILLDAIVMILPLKHLVGLNMNIRRKLMVMAMFSVGIIVIVISVLRLYSLVHFANSKNITWDYFEAGYWSLLEIDVSIICGSMPAHRYLVSKLWPKIKLTFHSGQGQSTRPTGLSSAGTSRFDSVQKLSVKPKIDGDGDFVPLVNMDTGSQHPTTKLEFDSEENRSDLSRRNTIMRTQETIVSHNDVDHWPMASAATSKEHV